MAVEALIPFPLVFTTVNREIFYVMIKCSGHPGGLAVATGAVRWKLCCSMVGVVRLVVVTNMASCAGVWRTIIVPVVAGGAIIRNSSMRPVQRVIIIMHRKCGRLPPRSSVAGRTVRRYRKCNVVRIGTLVVVRRVATRASIRCVGVIPVVADITVTRNGSMRTCQRIKTIVIKSRGHPRSLTVASGAVRRKLLGGVIRVSCLVVIRRVAACAGIWRIGVVPVVTGGAIIRNQSMHSV